MTDIRITDSHCHLDFPDFEGQTAEIVSRAASHGVHRMVTICTRLRHEPRVRALAEAPQEPKLRFLLGVVEAEAGQPERARATWRALLADSPPDAPWRALVERRLGALP